MDITNTCQSFLSEERPEGWPESFTVPINNWGISVNRSKHEHYKDRRSSFLWFLRNGFLLPSQAYKHLYTIPVRDLANHLDGDMLPGDLKEVFDDDFFLSLEEAELDRDTDTVKAMWGALGVKANIGDDDLENEPSEKQKKKTILDVLDDSNIIIMCPVAFLSEKTNLYRVRPCVVSGNDLRSNFRECTATFPDSAITYDDAVTEATWTYKNSKDEEKPFKFSKRLHRAFLKKETSSLLTALASILSYEGYEVIVCSKENVYPFGKNTYREPYHHIPTYKWVRFNHKEPIHFSPIESEIVKAYFDDNINEIYYKPSKNLNTPFISKIHTKPKERQWQVDRVLTAESKDWV